MISSVFVPRPPASPIVGLLPVAPSHGWQPDPTGLRRLFWLPGGLGPRVAARLSAWDAQTCQPTFTPPQAPHRLAILFLNPEGSPDFLMPDGSDDAVVLIARSDRLLTLEAIDVMLLLQFAEVTPRGSHA